MSNLWVIEKESTIVLHDIKIFRPQKLNIKIKNEAYFHMKKEFLRGEIQIFVKKGLPKLSFKIGSNFSVILRFAKKILLFVDKVRCSQLLGKNVIDIWPLANKIRPLAPKCAKLERFKVKRHKFAENQPIAEVQNFSPFEQ